MRDQFHHPPEKHDDDDLWSVLDADDGQDDNENHKLWRASRGPEEQQLPYIKIRPVHPKHIYLLYIYQNLLHPK